MFVNVTNKDAALSELSIKYGFFLELCVCCHMIFYIEMSYVGHLPFVYFLVLRMHGFPSSGVISMVL